MNSSPAIELAKHVLLVLGTILAVGTIGSLVARKLRAPDVVIYLLAGTLLGREVLGVVDIEADSVLNQVILILGSSYILFDGGAALRVRVLKEVWISILMLATVGVLITAFITGIAAQYILGIPFLVALLLGATLASTDPATLMPVFRQIPIRDRVAQTVMAESAFNDVMGAILTFTVLGIATGIQTFSVGTTLTNLLEQSAVGIVTGGLFGYLAAMFIAHERYGYLAEFASFVTLITVVGAYLVADGLRASGFMAVFVFGIVLGNKDSLGFPLRKGEKEGFETYVTTTALFMRIFVFILLGAQVDFALMREHLLEGCAIVLVLMFVARPATVFLCTLPDRRVKWEFKEMLFMCWTRVTGVIPSALAGLLLGMEAPQARLIASVTFIAILLTILLEATTTRWVAAKLGVLEAK